MKIGYVRVSTVGQHTGRQEDLMDKLGVEKIFVDKESGAKRERPGLNDMLSFVREGDTLIVESISRLARSTRDLLQIVDMLKAKDVQLIIQKEKRIIQMELELDDSICTVMDYFEIFLKRMMMCRRAAERLDCKFKLMANGSKLC